MALPYQPLKGLIDGLAVLQHLASSHREVASIDISRELGMEKTRVNRILKTLTYLGMAYQTAKRKYTVGPGVHVLSAQMLHGSGLINHSLKHLIKLTELNLVVAMGVLWRDKVSYLYHWEPGIPPTEGLGRIDVFPGTQSSIGLMLMAGKTDSEIRELIPEYEVPGYDSREDLLKDLDQIRTQNYAVAIYEGKKSIAVKVGDPPYAAIALSRIDVDAPNEPYLLYLREAALQIDLFQTTNKPE